jgi:Dynein heavy chain, N-terminal region 1
MHNVHANTINNRCLAGMGRVTIPSRAQAALAQQARYKSAHAALRSVLERRSRVLSRVVPAVRPLLSAHVRSADTALRPGWTSLTWSSVNIENWLQEADRALQQLEAVASAVCDVAESRIEGGLRAISKTLLVDLPTDGCMTLEAFVTVQVCLLVHCLYACVQIRV